MRVHELRANPNNVHWGFFSAAISPVLTIQPGDMVVFEDIPRLSPHVVEESGVIPAGEISQNHRAIFQEVHDRGSGPHIMVGPVYIDGAEPGDTLEVRITDVELAYSYGHNLQRSHDGALPEEFPHDWQRVVSIDPLRRVAKVAANVLVPCTRPFFGNMGVAPHPRSGRISTIIPGPHGGNLDNKDLCAGSILYLPVHVHGALFSVGDGHAAQGHGEVDLTAIETGLCGRFQFCLHKGLRHRWPRAETPSHWIVMGLHEDLDEALRIAVREAVDAISERFPHVTRREAYMITSIAVDFHVTQVVNQVKGIHGLIPKSIFEGWTAAPYC